MSLVSLAAESRNHLTDSCVLLQRIIDIVDVYVALVKQVMEHIDSVNSSITLLLVTEDQINPLMEMLTDIVTFKRLPVDSYEFSGILFRPWR